MTAGENMKKLLVDCGVYRPEEDTPLDWELAAYQAGFALLEEALAAARQEMFVPTAPAERLGWWETQVFPQPVQADLPTRREMLLQRMRTRPEPLAPADLPGLLLAAGIRGTAEESGGQVVITVSEYLVPQAQAQKELARLLPLHVQWELAEEQE